MEDAKVIYHLSMTTVSHVQIDMPTGNVMQTQHSVINVIYLYAVHVIIINGMVDIIYLSAKNVRILMDSGGVLTVMISGVNGPVRIAENAFAGCAQIMERQIGYVKNVNCQTLCRKCAKFNRSSMFYYSNWSNRANAYRSNRQDIPINMTP